MAILQKPPSFTKLLKAKGGNNFKTQIQTKMHYSMKEKVLLSPYFSRTNQVFILPFNGNKIFA